jgi:hypothetical protein
MGVTPTVDRVAPVTFLRTAYAPDDWVAVFMKSYETGQVAQRVGPRTLVESRRFQGWLRWRNLLHWNIYISVNAMAPGCWRRTRDAVGAIRHVFVEADHGAAAVLGSIRRRRDLPAPSYVLHSSPGRVHVFWRVAGFDGARVEALQRRLSSELGTDAAATPSTQTTRLPGFFNHKRERPHLVTIEYLDRDRTYGPSDFPKAAARHQRTVRVAVGPRPRNAIERARQYVRALPPAVSGEHGDLRTFQVCCRLVRGFALSDDDAMHVLSDWNGRCEPPWSDRELRDKLRRARRYGREPIGGLLDGDSRFGDRQFPKAQ